MKEHLTKGMPELAAEWSDRNELSPDKFTLGSQKSVWWIGSCGHEWKAAIQDRVDGSGCPYCTSHKLLIGFNDLASKNPKLAEEWSDRNYPLQPEMVMVQARRKVWWMGKCGHEWEARIASRYRGVGCPYCCGKVIIAGYNDLATTRPALIDEWSEKNTIDPTKISERCEKTALWVCRDCGYEWRKGIKTRCNGGGECPACRREFSLQLYQDRLEKEREEWKHKRDLMKKCILYYSKIAGITCKEDHDPEIGLPIAIYLPDMNVAIEVSTRGDKRKYESVKNRILRRRGIVMIRILEPGTKKYDNSFCILRKERSYKTDNAIIEKVFNILGIAVDVDINRDMDEIRQVTLNRDFAEREEKIWI